MLRKLARRLDVHLRPYRLVDRLMTASRRDRDAAHKRLAALRSELGVLLSDVESAVGALSKKQPWRNFVGTNFRERRLVAEALGNVARELRAAIKSDRARGT
jgi:hypothetical protein